MGLKRPAYQWYTRDARADEVFMLMTYEQQGVYRALLDHQWDEGSLPGDPALIAGLLPKLSVDRFLEIWPLISCKFRARTDGRLINDRLEAQRRELNKFLRHQKARGRKSAAMRKLQSQTTVNRGSTVVDVRLQPDGNSSTSSSTSTKNQEHTESSATSAEPEEAVLLVFPTIGAGPKAWGLPLSLVEAWQVAYPGVDVAAEMQRALIWIRANRPKTAKGMPRFLVSWLNRAADRGGAPRPSLAGKTAGNDAALASFVGRHQGRVS